MFKTCNFSDDALLEKFARGCFHSLSKSVVAVPYPEEVLTREGKKQWAKHENAIDKALAPILDEISGRGGVYCLLTGNRHDDRFVPQYVGHAGGPWIRQRIRNHLVKRHAKTGAQLENVKLALTPRTEIGLSFVEIVPATLRLYVEVWLIDRMKPDWNIQSIDLKGNTTRYAAKHCAWGVAD